MGGKLEVLISGCCLACEESNRKKSTRESLKRELDTFSSQKVKIFSAHK